MNDHLNDIDMGYFEHLYHAWSMVFALLLHGLVPFLLTDYASDKKCYSLGSIHSYLNNYICSI